MSEECPMYGRGPTWTLAKFLNGTRFVTPRLFLVSNARPLRMAFAWRQPDNRWTLDTAGVVPLDFEPTFVGDLPDYPPLTVEQAQA